MSSVPIVRAVRVGVTSYEGVLNCRFSVSYDVSYDVWCLVSWCLSTSQSASRRRHMPGVSGVLELLENGRLELKIQTVRLQQPIEKN